MVEVLDHEVGFGEDQTAGDRRHHVHLADVPPVHQTAGDVTVLIPPEPGVVDVGVPVAEGEQSARAVLRSDAERVGVLDRARGFLQQLRNERVRSDRCRQELREPSREVGVAHDPIADLVRRHGWPAVGLHVSGLHLGGAGLEVRHGLLGESSCPMRSRQARQRRHQCVVVTTRIVDLVIAALRVVRLDSVGTERDPLRDEHTRAGRRGGTRRTGSAAPPPGSRGSARAARSGPPTPSAAYPGHGGRRRGPART